MGCSCSYDFRCRNGIYLEISHRSHRRSIRNLRASSRIHRCLHLPRCSKPYHRQALKRGNRQLRRSKSSLQTVITKTAEKSAVFLFNRPIFAEALLSQRDKSLTRFSICAKALDTSLRDEVRDLYHIELTKSTYRFCKAKISSKRSLHIACSQSNF